MIYKNDDNYVRPLDVMIEEIFDPASNDFFAHGDAVRFLLLSDDDKVIGRTGVFINEKKAYGYKQPTGGMGFFECVNDKAAAFMLFDAARDWLSERGMEAMDGPINFGENDTFWGLLVDGFTSPAFGVQYNPPYYKDFFEEYGFASYFEQVTNHLDLQKPFPERFWKIAGWVGRKPGYEFKHFQWDKSEEFIKDFIEIYNDAWQFHENFTPMKAETLRNSLKEAKDFMDEELIWFAYHEGTPIGFFVQFPDVNQIIKHFHGKMNVWNKLKFVYLKWRKVMTRTRVVIMGIRPRWQRNGIESGIFWHLRNAVSKKPWLREMELSWVGDFNPKMRALHESVGADFGKKHITYRFIFDEEKRKEGQHAASIPNDTKGKVKS
ncbi:GNAT family N-acetyltransferase [Marinilabilia salmonicolor]|uniref:GNAT family N-acetyltransferase n=2 Tax=Marinilabilia salmonicolor TaxID=989 RepID=UPI001EE64F9A|nr:GNAT family N-acetyltransferase [Marinilabilia salmonicolor]